jgi:signal transduction histidine kinase
MGYQNLMVLSPQLVGSVQVVAGLAALVLLKPAVDNLDKPGSKGYAVCTAGISLWMFGLAIPKFTADYVLTVGSFHVLTFGNELAVAGWLLLALSITGRRQFVRRAAIVLGGGILLLQLLLLTNHFYQFLYAPDLGFPGSRDVGGVDAAIIETVGWWWPIHTTANYLCGLTGEAILLGGALRSTGIRRKQFAWLSLAAVPVILASVVSTFGVFDLPYNVSSVGFLLAVPVLAVVLFRSRFLDIVPVARRTAMDKMDAAMITLDGQNRVLDANKRARDLFDSGPAYVGTPVEAFFEFVPAEVLSEVGDDGDVDTEVTIGFDGEQRHFSLSVSPISDHPDQGRVVLLHDITPQKRRERELEEAKRSLEQSNERLDRFASTVSHDLQNPLQVAQGYLDLVETDSEHLDAVEDAHERMEVLIDDLLTLARQGDVIEETEAVALAPVAETTWQHVSTGEATLAVETEQTLRADASRVAELLENLFRNAVEHGGEDVTVTVGDVDDGFYVADDGSGVPVEERGDVFDTGYSTADDGTGFGLSIVRDIVNAHGWDIAVTDSESGGARFEITTRSSHPGTH